MDTGLYFVLFWQGAAWRTAEWLLTVTSYQCNVDVELKGGYGVTFTGSNPTGNTKNTVTIKSTTACSGTFYFYKLN